MGNWHYCKMLQKVRPFLERREDLLGTGNNRSDYEDKRELLISLWSRLLQDEVWFYARMWRHNNHFYLETVTGQMFGNKKDFAL